MVATGVMPAAFHMKQKQEMLRSSALDGIRFAPCTDASLRLGHVPEDEARVERPPVAVMKRAEVSAAFGNVLHEVTRQR